MTSFDSPEMERGAAVARGGTLWALALVALCATAVTAPMWFLGNASGHDFQFHLASWLDVAGQWREGILYPRWAEWANYGFGEPRFIFYPPLSWTLAALLSFALPWKMVPGAVDWIALVVGGLGAWRLAREWLTPRQALAAAALYAVNPYHLIVVYYRADFAELLASALFPFLVWRALKLIRNGWRAAPPLACVFALVWLANAPAAVIATYSLALIIFVGSLYRRNATPLLSGAGAMLCGFGLATFYILPAAFEQRWVQISEALVTLLEPWDNFLYTHAPNPEFLFFNWKVSTVAMGVLLAAGIAAVFVARRRATLGAAWWVLLAIAALSVCLMFPASVLLWKLLPKLAFVQFPWRWLGPFGLAFAFFVAAAPTKRLTQAVAWSSIAVLTLALGAAIVGDCWWDSEDIPVISGGIHSGNGYEGVDEYQPIGSDRYSLPGADVPYGDPPGPPTPQLQVLADSGKMVAVPLAQLHVTRWNAEQREFISHAEDDTTVGVRLLKYPAWIATIDGAPAETKASQEDGQLLIDVPPGEHTIALRFTRTKDRVAGDAISGTFVLIVAGWWMAMRRKDADGAAN